MKILMTILISFMISTSALAIDFENPKGFEHIEEYGTHYLICSLDPVSSGKDADLVFIWDELDKDTAWVYLLLKENLPDDVDDHMLAFMGDLDQVFPMQRFEDGDPKRDLLCMIDRASLLQFLYELTHSNTRLMKLSLNSEFEDSREWVLYLDQIPEYINH